MSQSCSVLRLGRAMAIEAAALFEGHCHFPSRDFADVNCSVSFTTRVSSNLQL